MKIYTKTGDDGTTGLFGGDRVSKNDARVEAYGTIDELNASLGVARAAGVDAWTDAELGRIQSELFVAGAELACAEGKEAKLKMDLVSDAHIAALESGIDHAEGDLPPLKSFVLPGGSAGSAALHFARTVCRRAERRTLAAIGQHRVVRYLNRLSDYLFVLARRANAEAKVEDVPWAPRTAQD